MLKVVIGPMAFEVGNGEAGSYCCNIVVML